MFDSLLQSCLPPLERIGPKLVSWMLVGLIGLEGVRMLAVFAPTVVPAAAVPRPAARRLARIDPGSIVAAHLFGVADADPGDPASPAAASANLILVGTIATARPLDGVAIIAADGPAKVYRVGERISGAALHSVYANRVILDRAGRLETLLLAGAKLRPKGAADEVHAVPASAEAAPAAEAPDEAASTAAVSQAIQAQPAVDTVSGMRGFRVRPGHDIHAFLQSGLRQNDVVTAVNGTPLADADPENAKGLLSASFAAKQATVTVMRNGRPVDLALVLDR